MKFELFIDASLSHWHRSNMSRLAKVTNIKPCSEHALLSANFEIWKYNRTRVLSCAQAMHFLASLTPGPAASHEDHLP